MNELVALHTQALGDPLVGTYLDVLSRVLRTARLSSTFPDRRRLTQTARVLAEGVRLGLYDRLFIDARAGLPNLASLTRAVSDYAVAMEARPSPDATKRAYRELVRAAEPAPVDEHRVVLRRHDAGRSRAEVRFELIKLAGSGLYTKVTVDLVQTGGVWSHDLVRVDADTEVAAATAGLRTTVYRLATYDAEALFLRLQKLDGVEVQRVERGTIGPILYALPTGNTVACPVQPAPTPLATGWAELMNASPPRDMQVVATFGTDIAGIDVRSERSNDPLATLISEGVRDDAGTDYEELRQRHPFRVYKDRKFVVTPGFRALVDEVCASGGTKNLIYTFR